MVFIRNLSLYSMRGYNMRGYELKNRKGTRISNSIVSLIKTWNLFLNKARVNRLSINSHAFNLCKKYPYTDIELMYLFNVDIDKIDKSIKNSIDNFITETQNRYMFEDNTAIIAMYLEYDCESFRDKPLIVRSIFCYHINTITGDVLKVKNCISRDELFIHIKRTMLNVYLNKKKDE